MTTTRIQSVDIVKGLALALVSMGYMNWYLPSNNWWVDSVGVFLSSLEAPLFYTAAGYTMALKAEERSFAFFIQRMIALFFFKAFIDLAIFGILPLVDGSSFVTLGLGCPLIYACNRFGKFTRGPAWSYLAGFFVIVLVMPLLQSHFGYRQLPTNADYWDNYPSLLEQWQGISRVSGIWRNWFIDGWNPFFPFAGFMLLGSFMSAKREEVLARRSLILMAAVPILAASYVLWPALAPAPLPRFGQLEVQFPPSLIFAFTFGLASALALLIFESKIIHRSLGFLSMLGRSPLFNFILISALVRFCVYPNLKEKLTLLSFLGVWLLINATLFAATFALGFLNRKYIDRNTWFPLRMLAGDYRAPRNK